MVRSCRSFPTAFSQHRICKQGWDLFPFPEPRHMTHHITPTNFISQFSLQPLKPKHTVLLNQIVFSRASGVDFPNNALPYSSFMSSSVSGTHLSRLPFFLILMPFVLFQTRCQSEYSSRNSSSLNVLQNWPS